MNIRKIPKAELHCHVDGLLNPQIAKKLPVNHETRSLLKILKKRCPVKDFSDWIEHYGSAIDPFVQNRANFLIHILAAYLNELKKQNTVYSEIMLSRFTFQFADIESQLEIYKRFREMADMIGGNDLQIEFLIAFARTNDRTKMEKWAERILSVAKGGLICGVVLAGLEKENTVKPYSDIFLQFKNAGLGIEIHAGEWTGPEYIWEAIEYGYADRIGHGLSAFDDPELIRHIKNKNIHLEFSPTGNILLTKIKNIKEHPIRYALAEDISFSINTDDPGPFCTNLNNEYTLVQKTFNLTKNDFDKILNNSFNAAFGKKKTRVNWP